MFSLFNFSSIFPGGQLTPFAPMCERPCVTCKCSDVDHGYVFSNAATNSNPAAVGDRRNIAVYDLHFHRRRCHLGVSFS